MDLTFLSSQLGKYQDMPSQLPPVNKWDPEFSGDIDILIKADGTWLHEGEIIQREKLVRLFSTILKEEKGEYFLVTPVEKWRIRVEDQPFVVVLVQFISSGASQIVRMITNTGDEFELDDDHFLMTDRHEAPKALVRNNMFARLGRNVFYEIADRCVENKEGFFIQSNGNSFKVGD